MSIQVGERIPNITLAVMRPDGPAELSADEIFGGKKVVLFALPGAYTPTCSQAHLPGYVVHRDAIVAKGVDTIACLSVNDAFVMGAWGEASNAGDILMLADGSGAFTEAVGLTLDLTDRHMGVRSQRYAMVVDDGVVTHLNVEDGGGFKVSDAETVLGLL
ncbi:MAG: peroxiredoxin [Gammaproteobacteria bacterium]|nr:peroxiredoxin [Gammaproteobacteria bacterium]MDD9884517.1 peroxiredoxin [Gammaproteobacteria bacterium]